MRLNPHEHPVGTRFLTYVIINGTHSSSLREGTVKEWTTKGYVRIEWGSYCEMIWHLPANDPSLFDILEILPEIKR